MKKQISRWIVVVFSVLLLSTVSKAQSSGPIIANNILGGAGAGAVVGLSVGVFAYGMGNNYNPDFLVNGAVYGFLTGAVLGTGVGVYEITNRTNASGFTVAEYAVGGTGIGALLGLVVATVPYMRDNNPEDFTIGLGLGGIIGAVVGLGFAAIDISTDSSGQGDDMLLSGKIGLQHEAVGLVKYIPEATREPVVCCRLVALTF
ncbi:hypothetical protein K8S19_09055 [bacterium]|nr:hypothetical protein [bacterium]